MHTVRKTNEQIFWEEKHLLRQLKFFAKSHNESKKCIITAIDQWTLSRIHRQLEGPANPKGAYHYPPWSGDSNSTIRVVQKSLVFANTLANLKTATLNYIFRWRVCEDFLTIDCQTKCVQRHSSHWGQKIPMKFLAKTICLPYHSWTYETRLQQ